MCWDCYNNDKGDPYKNFRNGAVEVEDFEDEIPYRHPPRKKKKKRAEQRRPGCVGNNYGPHVFVWTQELERENTIFFRFYGFHKYQREVCAGCGKIRKVEHSERYSKRNERAWKKLKTPEKGVPVSNRGRYFGLRPSFFRFEVHDEKYMEYRKEFIDKTGWIWTELDGRFLD